MSNSKNNDGIKEVNGILHQQLVRSLNYLTMAISYTLSLLIQFMAKLHESHWQVKIMILQYLKRINHFGRVMIVMMN